MAGGAAVTTLRAWRAITAGTLISRGCILLDSHHLTGLRATADPWERASGSQASAIIETAGSNPCNGNAFSPASLARRIRTSQRARRQCWSPPVTLLMVPDGRCQRAGPAAAGTGVLPLSVDDPGGARVTCGSRALVTADKGNGPLRVRSNAGVGAGPVVHWLALAPRSERRQERWISRTSRSSVGTGRRQGAGTGPRPRAGRAARSSTGPWQATRTGCERPTSTYKN